MKIKIRLWHDIFDTFKIFETGRVLLLQNTKLGVKNGHFKAKNACFKAEMHVFRRALCFVIVIKFLITITIIEIQF